MDTIALGTGGLRVSAIGLGCMGMSEFYGPAHHADSLAALRRAAELGIDFLDTSDAYGIGANEELIGEFLRGTPRENVVLATKFGVLRDKETGRPLGVRGDAQYVREACDASLRRLGVDHIDLYYQHLAAPGTPIEETVAAMADLVTAGKVRHLGLSNIGPDQLRAAVAVHPIAAVQNEWSLFTRTSEAGLIPECVRAGVGLVPYAPLGRGFLTGVYTSTEGLAADDYRQAVPRFNDPANSAHNAGLLKVLREIADAYQATPGQVALAWLIGQGGRLGLGVAPIPGSKNADRVAENAAAAGLSLTEADYAALEPLADQVLGSATPPLPAEIARLRAASQQADE